MARIIELGDGPMVYARYNTNLSRVRYRGVDLYRDILSKLRDYQICASVDGTGEIGEYIRTGMSWSVFQENFQRGLAMARHPRQMRLDFTLTLPGLFEVENMQQLSDQLGADLLAKVIFSFTPDIIMSPLALPRSILDRKISELLPRTRGALQDVLRQLQQRPNFQESWPNEYESALQRGKSRIQRLEQIRGDKFCMEHILANDKEIYDWWQDIR